jgi:hypothetical protein
MGIVDVSVVDTVLDTFMAVVAAASTLGTSASETTLTSTIPSNLKRWIMGLA